MYQFATITGKRQLTIPADLYRKAGFIEGQKVIVSLHDNALRVESAVDLVERLAGSLPTPPAYRGMSMPAVLAKTKQQYVRLRGGRRGL